MEVTMGIPTLKRTHKPIVNAQVLRMRALGYIKPQEAAARAGISLPRIYALLDEGKLQGKTIATRRYVLLRSLVAHFGGEISAASSNSQ